MRTFLLLSIYLGLVSCAPSTQEEILTSYYQNSEAEFYACPKSGNRKKNQRETASQDQEERLIAKSIYGTDDRRDWFESSDDIKNQWAKATLALIEKSKIQRNGNGFYRIIAKTYGEEKDLCSDVPFIDQPTLALCSGFLIHDDLIITAGHCLKNNWECENTYFVFDFAKQQENQDKYEIPASSIYSCGEIITRKTDWDDFAVIRLDRAVKDRSPLKFRRRGSVSVGEELTLIGHPAGLPSKITEGSVKEVSASRFFANIDASSGNSGSPVINTRLGFVEGVLVSGVQDYKKQGSCKVEYSCDDDDCTGELIIPISRILAQIPQLCIL